MIPEQSPDDLAGRTGDPTLVRRVFDQLPLIVCSLAWPRLRFVATTKAYRTYAGRENVTGMEFFEAFPEVEGQLIAELFYRVIDTGQAESLRDWRVQFDLPDTGGHVEAFVDFVVWPLRAPDGTVEGVTLEVTDVTERVRERQAAQQEVADAERRYAHARDVIDVLQRELLPGGVPVVPGVEIAASYLLADADTAAGGDWFDAVALRDGRIALIVGDVVGHGVRASAIMGQLRVLLTDHLVETGDIALALEAVDRHAHRVRAARSATVCVAVIDPDTGDVEYLTAGHPPPLVVPAAGEPRYLLPTGAAPLATSSEFPVVRDRLGPGDLLLLYTDGILERPRRDLAGASVELSQVVADVTAGRALPSDDPTTVERVTTQSLELLTRATGHTDDITLLAAQRVIPAAPFTMRTAAVPTMLAECRAALGSWLDAAHVPATDASDVQHAVGELVSNAVEHAYRDTPQPGPVEVTANLTRDGEIRVRVRDDGRWREPVTSTDRGRGLWMAGQLIDELIIEHPGDTTTALLQHRLSRPARLLTAETFIPPAPTAAAIDQPFLVDEPAPGRLRVAGPIDATTAPALAAALAHLGAGGTRALPSTSPTSPSWPAPEYRYCTTPTHAAPPTAPHFSSTPRPAARPTRSSPSSRCPTPPTTSTAPLGASTSGRPTTTPTDHDPFTAAR